MSTDPWLKLAEETTAAERLHSKRAEQAWRRLDVIEAVHLRGIAEGLEIARELQLEVSAKAREETA